MNSSVSQDHKVGPGAYFALAFAAVFFSGLLGGKEWYGVFDFTTLNGAFGKVVSKASLDDGTLTTASSAFRGTGGSHVHRSLYRRHVHHENRGRKSAAIAPVLHP